MGCGAASDPSGLEPIAQQHVQWFAHRYAVVCHARRYKLQRTLTGHTRSIVSVKFSSDGALLASGAADKTVRIWNADTGDLIRVLEGHTQVRHRDRAARGVLTPSHTVSTRPRSRCTQWTWCRDTPSVYVYTSCET